MICEWCCRTLKLSFYNLFFVLIHNQNSIAQFLENVKIAGNSSTASSAMVATILATSRTFPLVGAV